MYSIYRSQHNLTCKSYQNNFKEWGSIFLPDGEGEGMPLALELFNVTMDLNIIPFLQQNTQTEQTITKDHEQIK